MAAIPVTSGLQLLLDARTITGLSDGDTVSAWSDSSGLGNNAAQSTLANRPLYKTNIYGTNPAVRFADTTDFMNGTFASWGTHAGQTLLMMVNNTPSSNTANGRWFGTSTNSSFDYENHLLYSSGTEGDLLIYQNFVAMKTTAQPTAYAKSITSPLIIGYAVTGTRYDYILNGVYSYNITHAAGLPPAPTKYSFGIINSGTPATGDKAKYDCHFAIVFNRRLTVAEIESVCCWMRTEIGLLTISGGTAKPSHPMKSQVIG